MTRSVRTAVVAWVITAVYFFYQYVLRSAPAVRPKASDNWGIMTAGADRSTY